MGPKPGQLFLIPTPVAEKGTLSGSLKEKLEVAFESGAGLLIEDEKPGRRRWLAWGLPRAAIDEFTPYNEHSRGELDAKILKGLSGGKDYFLMSDGGTPGFCDPGRSLIYDCQQAGIKVKMLSCDNSLLPAVALSGFTEGPFEFLGFPPKEKEERAKFFKSLYLKNHCQVFMDTPYRLQRVIEELGEASPENGRHRLHFLLMDINREEEESYWGTLKNLLNLKDLGKREFVLVVAPK
ncbi:MAG: hypothetical protein K9K67_04455 [Bacteriovoracaceae bacterium]|nr:hypothetical protein [Bacteriovoracaceae bacterium]